MATEFAREYVPGNPLVRPEQVPLLSTQICKLHDWYLREVKMGRQMLMVKVQQEQYFHANGI